MRGGKRLGAGRKPGSGGRQLGAISEAKRALAEMAKDHTEAALNVLVSVMGSSSNPAAARVTAASAILDRGYGKPPQALEHTGKDGEALIPESNPREAAKAVLAILSRAVKDEPAE